MTLIAGAPRIAVCVALAISLELRRAASVSAAETFRPARIRLSNGEVRSLPRVGHLTFVPRKLRANQPTVSRSFLDRLGLIAVSVVGKIEQRVELHDAALGSDDWLRLE